MDIQKELLLWVGAALVCAMVVSFIMPAREVVCL